MKSKKQLYQWDVNQYLIELQPTAEFVDYPVGNEVIRLETDGTRCRIPDEVLQTYGGKTCYERYPDGTFRAYSFSVLYAPKPPDYVYTPEERTTFQALTARVDAAIEEIKRRADSGEFDGKTPIKGVDYYTKEEKAELITAVSSGAESEFRKVTEEETAKFEATAESELTAYNRNAEEKLEAYNSNHAAKVAEYNANAETKKAEFDSNAAALQTEVDRLRDECDNLAAENRKQENRISALMKLNKGQTYDILPEEGEAASRTAPSGAKYVSVDKVGGKSLVWNQLYDRTKPTDGENNGITFSRQEDGSFVATGKNIDGTMSYVYTKINVTAGHIYFSKSIRLGDVGKSYLAGVTIGNNAYDRGKGALATASQTGIASFVVQMFEKGAEAKNEVVRPRVFDLTLMFGAGNEPTAEQFNAMFPAESYPYNPGEIISSTTANVELEGKNLWNDSDPAFTQVLLNAGFLYNSGVWHTNNIVFSSVNIGTIPQQSVLSYDILANTGLNPRIELFSGETRIMPRNLESTGKWIHHNLNIPSGTVIDRIVLDYASRGVCKIKNIQLERGTTETAYSPHTNQSLSTGFPELNSAGTAHDVIDLDGGAIRRNVGTVDLGSLTWDNNGTFEDGNVQFIAKIPGRAYTGNGLCDRFEKSEDNALGTYTLRTTGDQITFAAPEGTEINAFIESVNGATLYYELATPTTEQVAIPEALQEWLPVEPGGTVTFRNADESKQLPVPNAVSWVRKLNEVN